MEDLIDTFTLALEQYYFELRWGAHLYMDFFSRVNATVLHKVQFSLSVVSDSLQSHGLQHTRLPCPIFLPGELHGQRSLAGYSPSGHRVRHN